MLRPSVRMIRQLRIPFHPVPFHFDPLHSVLFYFVQLHGIYLFILTCVSYRSRYLAGIGLDIVMLLQTSLNALNKRGTYHKSTINSTSTLGSAAVELFVLCAIQLSTNTQLTTHTHTHLQQANAVVDLRLTHAKLPEDASEHNRRAEVGDHLFS